MNILAPKSHLFCFGHEKIEATLFAEFQSGKFPHSFIFYGNRGVGKETFAYRLLRFLLQENSLNNSSNFSVEENNPIVRQIKEGHAWNLFEISPDETKKTQIIDVKQIRDLRAVFTKKVEANQYRVVIVNPAEKMNRQASNALLKILEEPPERTVFILITDSLDALLPTIRSRCRLVRFSRLSGENIQKICENLSCRFSPMLLEKSKGSMGRLVECIENESLFDQIVALKKSPEKMFQVIKEIRDKDALEFTYQNLISFAQEENDLQKVEVINEIWNDFKQSDLDAQTTALLLLDKI
ncbi:MAG: AAA family ATPase, partial [Alphaproteobacteria bacterium]